MMVTTMLKLKASPSKLIAIKITGTAGYFVSNKRFASLVFQPILIYQAWKSIWKS